MNVRHSFIQAHGQVSISLFEDSDFLFKLLNL
jgi:hypothetical protein